MRNLSAKQIRQIDILQQKQRQLDAMINVFRSGSDSDHLEALDNEIKIRFFGLASELSTDCINLADELLEGMGHG